MKRALVAGVLAGAVLVRLIPLLASPLPFNVDGFIVADTAETFLETRRWVPDGHDTSRPGAMFLLVAASALSRLDPLTLAQPLFTALGLGAIAANWWFVGRFTRDPTARLLALAPLAFLGSFIYYSTAVMKQATGFVLLPLALGLLLAPRSRKEQWCGLVVFAALPLFHHFIAFIALTTAAFALIARAAIEGGWRRVPRFPVAGVAVAAAWSLAWVYAVREPIGDTWDMMAQDAWLYASLFTLAALAVHFIARAPVTPARAATVLAAAPALGTLALLAHAFVPLFEGAYPSPLHVTLAAVPYGLVLTLAAGGVALVLATRARTAKPLVLGLVTSILVILVFGVLRGLDAASFYLAQRTVDFVVPVLALAYGLAGAWLVRHAGARHPRAATAATLALLVLPALTVPIAFADADGLAFGNQVTRAEFDALAWAAENTNGTLVTDTRYGHVLNGYFHREVDHTLAFDLATGTPVTGTLIVGDNWATHGGEFKPISIHRVPANALPPTCETLHRTADARVLSC